MRKSSRAPGILILVIVLYMTDIAQSETGLERDLIQKAAEVEYCVMALSAFLHCVEYGPIDHFAYSSMVNGCSGGGALFFVSLGSIKF